MDSYDLRNHSCEFLGEVWGLFGDATCVVFIIILKYLLDFGPKTTAVLSFTSLPPLPCTQLGEPLEQRFPISLAMGRRQDIQGAELEEDMDLEQPQRARRAHKGLRGEEYKLELGRATSMEPPCPAGSQWIRRAWKNVLWCCMGRPPRQAARRFSALCAAPTQ